MEVGSRDVSPVERTDPSGELDARLRILLIEDSKEYADLVRTVLSRDDRFSVDHTQRLDSALAHLENLEYDAILLDLSLPDGYGAFTIGCACSLADHIPVIVLTGTADDELALAAVKAGAQDYLVKDEVSRQQLPGVILRAIERHRRSQKVYAIRQLERRQIQEVLRDLVTGLPNHVVFRDRLVHTLAVSRRNAQPFGTVVVRFESLDLLRDFWGKELADEILRAVAERLGGRVRCSDTLARIGDDSFGMIFNDIRSASDINSTVGALMTCLEQVTISDHPDFELGEVVASIGVAVYPVDGDRADTLRRYAETHEFATAGIGGSTPGLRSNSAT